MPTEISLAEDYSILNTGDEKDFNDLTTLASAICQTPIALINLFDEKKRSVKSLIVSNISKSALEQSFNVPDISAEQDILIVEDAASDERFLSHPYINENMQRHLIRDLFIPATLQI